MDIDSFFELLKDVCDELPDEFFRELHYGVQLSEALKMSPYSRSDDLVIMGEYSRSHYGNRIVIYYGSFLKTCSWMSEERLKERLREVVQHEFRHHMENLAGMHGRDSLEYEDVVELRKYLRKVRS